MKQLVPLSNVSAPASDDVGWHVPLTHVNPGSHPPQSKVPPHPLGNVPHLVPPLVPHNGGEGVHPHSPVTPPPPHVSKPVHVPQLPPQPSVPHGLTGAQVGAQLHAPELHVAGKEQTWWQMPQLLESLFVSTHEPEQLVRPVAHPVVHDPPEQTGVDPLQACPQLPQLLLSLAVSVQTPLHAIAVAGPGHLQAPDTQC